MIPKAPQPPGTTKPKRRPEPVIEIPRSVWDTAETKEEIEDWLASHDPSFIADLRRIRHEEHLAGKGKTLQDVARRWNTKL